MTTPFWARRDQCTAGAMHFNLQVHRKASLSSAIDQGLYTEEKNILAQTSPSTEGNGEIATQKLIEVSGKHITM